MEPDPCQQGLLSDIKHLANGTARETVSGAVDGTRPVDNADDARRLTRNSPALDRRWPDALAQWSAATTKSPIASGSDQTSEVVRG